MKNPSWLFEREILMASLIPTKQGSRISTPPPKKKKKKQNKQVLILDPHKST